MFDQGDAKPFADGKVDKKSLRPKQTYIHRFDVNKFLDDWDKNDISRRSFKCDGAFRLD